MTASATKTLVIDADKPGAVINPTMYGLFFEDINYAADGGLYAEMVKNRSFEFPQNLMGWHSFGNVTVRDDGPFDRNPHYVRLLPAAHPSKRTGLVNEGFFGIAYKAGDKYRFSVYARALSDQGSRISVQLTNPASDSDTQVLASVDIDIMSSEWKQYKTELTSPSTIAKGELRLFLRSSEGCDIEHVSLFPVDTWNGHENGLRKDLVSWLADMRPGVLRFPGGCIVEGADIGSRYQWKNTVGPVENRPLNESRWQHTFEHRFFPDYYQSGGLGFFEYFQLAEEIGAEPIPVINAGLACQYQNKGDDAHVPVDSMKPYVDDALDLIEFANGDTASLWGAVRASMGHPEPFGLKFLAIGNEQWGAIYPERLKIFVDAIRCSHPEIMIIGSSGPGPDGEKFDYLWAEMRRIGVDLVDEHFYRSEEWFMAQGRRYDDYDRNGPKVFVGEYACHVTGKKRNHFNAALHEAAFMTGLERNADVVSMATYAPLFAHVDGWQWRPDMIWFDNLRSVATTSYYVQKLFATHKGSNVLSLTMNGDTVSGNDGQDGLFASATVDADKNEFIIKVVNTADSAQDLSFMFNGLGKALLAEGSATVMSAMDADVENTLDSPAKVVPVTHTLQVGEYGFDVTIDAKTFAVYTVRQ